MHHHDLRRPIVNPRAAVPVIGSAKSVDDVVVVDVSGNCPAAFVSDDTAFFSTTYHTSILYLNTLSYKDFLLSSNTDSKPKTYRINPFITKSLPNVGIFQYVIIIDASNDLATLPRCKKDQSENMEIL
jgi:hypothetical protein